MSHCTWGESGVEASTTWDADWDYYSAAGYIVITLCPTPYYILKVSIVIIGIIKDSNRDLRIWLYRREWTLSWDLP